MSFSRRSFLQGIAAWAATAGLRVPAFSSQRKPYVQAGAVVDFIGHRPGFIGGQLVSEVLPWDGVGYPVVTKSNGFPAKDEVYYDVDLADLRRGVPDRFWHNPAHSIYPNVHSWLRVTRYGETLSEAIDRMGMVGL